jgi:hypothetical protein
MLGSAAPAAKIKRRRRLAWASGLRICYDGAFRDWTLPSGIGHAATSMDQESALYKQEPHRGSMHEFIAELSMASGDIELALA